MTKRKPGSVRGKVKMARDFDAPMELTEETSVKPKMPTVDGWLHLSAGYANICTFEQAKANVIRDMGRKPTPHEVSKIRRGYYGGLMADATRRLEHCAIAASLDDTEQIAQELQALAERWERKVSGVEWK